MLTGGTLLILVATAPAILKATSKLSVTVIQNSITFFQKYINITIIYFFKFLDQLDQGKLWGGVNES